MVIDDLQHVKNLHYINKIVILVFMFKRSYIANVIKFFKNNLGLKFYK